MADNIDYIVEQMFSKPAVEKGQARIEFDTRDIQGAFEAFCQIFSKGLKYKYSRDGKPLDISTLTMDQFNHIREYFLAFDIDVILEIVSVSGGACPSTSIIIKDKTKLEGHKLRLYKDGKFYIVTFKHCV